MKNGTKNWMLTIIAFTLMVFMVAVFWTMRQSPEAKVAVGSPSITQKVTIPIDGMSCSACVSRVNKKLGAMEGVHEVEISLKNREAEILYDPQETSPQTLSSAINELGYKSSAPKERAESAFTLENFLAGFSHSASNRNLFVILIAFLAGLVASAVCPCTLPIGLGMASVVGASETLSRRSGVYIAAAFFMGIVLNLTFLGILAAQMGGVLTESFGRYWALVMAVISLMAAAVAFWGPRLNEESLAALRKPGIVGAFGYGFIFSLGTSAAPLLVLLTVTAAQASVAFGVLLSVAFGIGRGLPFLLIGFFASAWMRFAHISLWRRRIQFASGGALILVALYYVRAFIDLI